MNSNILRLVRIANSPSVVSNIWAGYVLASGGNFKWQILLGGALASALIYSGGVALNDYADRKSDAVEHPDRLVPSGKIPPGIALLIAVTLILWGTFLGIFALMAVEIHLLPVIIILTASVLAYDLFLKKFWFSGGAGMGLCRGMNCLFGISLSGNINLNLLLYPAVMFAYIFSLTILARKESKNAVIERIVKIGILAIVIIDAVFLFACGYYWQGAVSAALIIPMFFLAKIFKMT